MENTNIPKKAIEDLRIALNLINPEAFPISKDQMCAAEVYQAVYGLLEDENVTFSMRTMKVLDPKASERLISGKHVRRVDGQAVHLFDDKEINLNIKMHEFSTEPVIESCTVEGIPITSSRLKEGATFEDLFQSLFIHDYGVEREKPELRCNVSSGNPMIPIEGERLFFNNLPNKLVVVLNRFRRDVCTRKIVETTEDHIKISIQLGKSIKYYLLPRYFNEERTRENRVQAGPFYVVTKVDGEIAIGDLLSIPEDYTTTKETGHYVRVGEVCHRGTYEGGHFVSYTRGGQGGYWHADDNGAVVMPTDSKAPETKNNNYIVTFLKLR